ncbi:MAG: hypothetical protein ACRELY_13825 [Polyangiaceae bacterium]
MSRKFLGLFFLLAASFGCSRAEEAVKGKAQQAIDNKVEEQIAAHAAKLTGGTVTAGALCPSWPKNVPVYPGATIIGCDEVDVPDGGTSDISAVLAAREGKAPGTTTPEVAAMLSLGLETTASSDDIVAFYKKSLPQYQSATQQSGGMSATALANKTNAADPVSTVLLMPTEKTSDGKTTSTIVVMLKKL